MLIKLMLFQDGKLLVMVHFVHLSILWYICTRMLVLLHTNKERFELNQKEKFVVEKGICLIML